MQRASALTSDQQADERVGGQNQALINLKDTELSRLNVLSKCNPLDVQLMHYPECESTSFNIAVTSLTWSM